LIARKDCLTLPFDRLHRDLQWALRRLKGEKKDV
jgi:RNase P protein component